MHEFSIVAVNRPLPLLIRVTAVPNEQLVLFSIAQELVFRGILILIDSVQDFVHRVDGNGNSISEHGIYSFASYKLLLSGITLPRNS
jgi:hypothetical protein